MDVKARAAYAWGRIVSLFSRKKPDIEVEVEEFEDMGEPAVSTEPVEETVITDEVVSFEPMEPAADETPEETVPSRGEAAEEPLPSRMTEEYKAWLREQMEEGEDRIDRSAAPEETEEAEETE